MTTNETFKVLIADGEPAILRTLGAYLRLKGFQPETTQSYAETMTWVDSNLAHIILLDLDMDGMDCLKLTELLRQKGDLSQIIAMSSKSTVDKIVGAYSFGASDYLPKPFKNLDIVGQAALRAGERLDRWRQILLQTLAQEGRL